MICLIHDKKYKFREYALPFKQETTIVILIALSIYSCDKCVSGNYIGETSNNQRFTLNNSKKSIKDNSRGFPLAGLFNHPDHLLKKLRCVILWGDFTPKADRLICLQTFNLDISFLSPNNKLHPCWQLWTSTSINNTDIWRQTMC